MLVIGLGFGDLVVFFGLRLGLMGLFIVLWWVLMVCFCVLLFSRVWVGCVD